MKKLYLALLLPYVILTAATDQKYIQLSHHLTNQHCDMVCKCYRLEPYASGGGMMFDIDLIHLVFVSHCLVNIDEARRLYINCTQDLLSRLNSDRKVRPYLRKYPFDMEGIKYSIFFNSRNDVDAPPPYIAHVMCANGTVLYDVTDPETFYRTVYEEPYEEAVRKVLGTSAN